ncbi:MAG: hypothetical protein OXU88_08430 [Gammaproteobacteria bacterium]|nr:hypothetical protein [Gammaproteobacteria bacterium]
MPRQSVYKSAHQDARDADEFADNFTHKCANNFASKWARRAARCIIAAALSLSLMPAASLADGNVPGWNKLVYLFYRIEVTNYCGLTTAAVIAGFQRRRDHLLATHALAAPLIDSARAEAWRLAHKEWDNRGLGGFRSWCHNDAARYANELAGR